MALKGLCSYIAIMYFKDGKDYFLFSLCLKKKKHTQKHWKCQDCQIFLNSK